MLRCRNQMPFKKILNIDVAITFINYFNNLLFKKKKNITLNCSWWCNLWGH